MEGLSGRLYHVAGPKTDPYDWWIVAPTMQAALDWIFKSYKNPIVTSITEVTAMVHLVVPGVERGGE